MLARGKIIDEIFSEATVLSLLAIICPFLGENRLGKNSEGVRCLACYMYGGGSPTPREKKSTDQTDHDLNHLLRI